MNKYLFLILIFGLGLLVFGCFSNLNFNNDNSNFIDSNNLDSNNN